MKKVKELRRVLAILISAAAISGAVGISAAYAKDTSAEATKLDLNLDGEVNSADVVTMQKYLTGQGKINKNADGDLNGDGRINIADFLILKKEVFTLSQSTQPTDPTQPEQPTEATEPTQAPTEATQPTETTTNPSTDPVEVESSIVLSNSGITVEGEGASLSSDSKVVTINTPGTYTVTGEMTGGQIVVDVDKTQYPEGKVTLSLEGMSLENTSNSPVYIASIADECVISAKKGTTNTIKDGTSYQNADEGTGAVYSKDDLKFKGKGTLNVYGNAGDAIVSKNSVKVFNGTINVYAVDDGIRGKDSVKIGDADDKDKGYDDLKVTIETENGDGIKSTNSTDDGKGNVIVNGGTVKITVKGMADGIQAERDLTINDGDINITTYKGAAFGDGANYSQDGNSAKTSESAKGLKAGDTDASITGSITINGGNITIDSSDDCMHCNGDLNLYGGVMNLSSSDDACHSDATLNIGKGTADTYDDVKVYISTCYEGMEGMNINQNSGSVIVNANDDGYNAAGGADGSGNTSPWGGWGQGGGFGGGGQGGPGGSSTGSYSLNIKGGLVILNCKDGDHDGFDSNGSLTISGGIAISNGNEAFDSDGTKSYTGGVYISDTGSGGMGGPGGMMGGGEMESTVSASASVSKGTRITLANGSDVIVSFIADKNVSKLVAGCKAFTSAKFYTGGTVSGTPTAEGGTQSLYTSGTLSGGTQLG